MARRRFADSKSASNRSESGRYDSIYIYSRLLILYDDASIDR